MAYYFAYGSNLSGSEMDKWCCDYKLVSVVKLVDYKLDFTRFSKNRQCGVADIVKSSNTVVWGVVYDIGEDEFISLDKKEGVASGAYKRIEVDVINVNEKTLTAQTYCVMNKQNFIKPSKEYLSIIIESSKKQNFPKYYINSLEKTETL
ncbi:MAG: gamma-glutamylcyclotransferase family protein [Clostridia bacterium]|jgi:gamma-glutamylcyclotransferase (GGCT)/AIG2-like uncharacterized protein YtfP